MATSTDEELAAARAEIARLTAERDGAREVGKAIARANEALADKLGSIARDLRLLIARIEGP